MNLSRRELILGGGGVAACSGAAGLLSGRRLPNALPNWARQEPIISVLDHGATGDGRHDDAQAVQSAIDQVRRAGGGVVLFPAGRNYLLDRQIQLCDNLTVLGSSGARLIAGRSFAGIIRPLFKNFAGLDFVNPGRVVANKCIAFVGIEIDGQDAGRPGELLTNEEIHGAMICLGGWPDESGVDKIFFHDCYLHDFSGGGIVIWNSTDIEISANRFTNFFANDRLSVGSGIDLHAVRRVQIRENQIHHDSTGLSWHGMVVLDWSFGSSEVAIVNNQISDMNGGDGISCEGNRGAGSNLANCRIAGNLIRRCAGQGIGVDNCHDVIVEDNKIDMVIGPGILFTGTPCATIRRNEIRASGLGGILSASGTQQASIQDNRITSVRYYDPQYRGEGINVTAADTAQVEIRGNIVRDIDGAGIYLVGSGNLRENRIEDAGKSPKLDAELRAGIVTTAPSEVRDNEIIGQGVTEYAISSAAGDFPTMAGNTITGRFGRDHFYIGYRAGRRVAVSITASDARYDAHTNFFQGHYAGEPGGYWFRGDTFFNTVSRGKDARRLIATGTPSQWQRLP